MSKRQVESYYKKQLKICEQLVSHNTTTNNLELNKIGSDLLGDRFMGVYSKDTIPWASLVDSPGNCCIANVEIASDPGTHWIALYGPSDTRFPILYDSFGREFNEILTTTADYKMRRKEVTLTEGDPEQRVSEKNCGQRCLAFLATCQKFKKTNQIFYV